MRCDMGIGDGDGVESRRVGGANGWQKRLAARRRARSILHHARRPLASLYGVVASCDESGWGSGLFPWMVGSGWLDDESEAIVGEGTVKIVRWDEVR